MKKIGLILLAVLLVLPLALTACSKTEENNPSSVLNNEQETAYKDENGDTYLYVPYTSNSVEIIGYSGSDAFHAITIPGTIDNRVVAKIGKEAFKDNNAITEVSLPDSVTEIGEYAFAGCDYLTNVHFSSGLTTIGEGAFYQSALTTASLPAKLEEIGLYAFYQCRGLESVSFSGTVLGTIAVGAFFECTALEAIAIPEGTTSIGYQAFYGCTALVDLTVPSSVTEIGKYAFAQVPAMED